MSDFLKDYQDYYRVRMERYENDPDYQNSYQSEKAIYEAIASCTVLGEFKEKLGNLNEKNAMALTKDDYTYRYKHYMNIKEFVRAKGPQRIVERADQCANVSDLITMVGEEENKNMLEISVDHIYFFRDCWVLLDNIERYEKAEVPSSYKSERQKFANEMKADIKNRYKETIEEMQKWQDGWKIDFDLIWEERHRRLIPYKDEDIRTKIEQLKTIINS